MTAIVTHGKLSSVSVERRSESGFQRSKVGEQKILKLLGNFRRNNA